MQLSRRRVLCVLPLWLACAGWLLVWWLNPGRVNFLPLYIPLTGAIFYEFIFLPSMLTYFLLRAKRPPRRQVLKNQKVAVTAPCVPAVESLDIVEKQLQAMQAITYPHDSWILDEGKSRAVQKLARKYGVKYFSRRGIRKYNQPRPPFKAKTKAGNINAWLEHVKRRKYDFFVQLDIDHLAKPNYLHKTLGFFRDPEVGWVQAPSVYKNRNHWTSRGAAEQELVLQGPMQMGFYGHNETPFIIGSHCTYRMSAVKEIGGFQPTRAEDHLDTLAMAHLGYKGIFLPEVIAEGDGPVTLSTYLAQQFAWAYSMFQVLISYSPRLLKGMPFKKKWQFLFAQTWYPLWALSYLTMFMMPILALIAGRDIARMHGRDFFLHFVPVFACSFLVWWSARPLMHPGRLRLSWRGILLHVVRWPVVLRAVANAAFKVKRPYMITPKGRFAHNVPLLATYRPFLLLGFLSASAMLYSTAVHGELTLVGQTMYALLNALFMLVICLVDTDLHLRDAKKMRLTWDRGWLKPLAAVTALMLVISGAVVTSPVVTQPLASAEALVAPAAAPGPAEKLVPLSRMTTEELTAVIKSLPEQPSAPASNLGLYNATGLPYVSQPYTQHIFVDWNDPYWLARQIVQGEQRGNTMLVTIEPRGEPDGPQLLTNISSGSEDAKLQALATVLAASKRPVFVRFAHEMELSNLYPWADQDPAQYIAAYRHVVDYMRTHGGERLQWVWSPAGNDGAQVYYPGDDVVDVVGTTVLQDPYWSQDAQPQFPDLVGQRLWLKSFNKPVWIVEFGVGQADPHYQQDLITQAIYEYQLLGFSRLIYLNIPDANIRGPNYYVNDTVVLGQFYGARIPVAAATHSGEPDILPVTNLAVAALTAPAQSVAATGLNFYNSPAQH